MERQIITPVTEEPVTLAEAKLHLKLSSDSFASDVATEQSISPGSHDVIADYGLIGAAVDVLDYISLVTLNAGACGSGGSIDAKIQESDDNISWQDFSGGAFEQVTEANDETTYEIDYSGGKQYIRVVATIEGAACSFSADVISKSGDEVEDSLIELWISTAREVCEERTRRALATQTIEAYLDDFPYRNYFELPMPPLQSVSSIKYIDSDGNETTMTEGTDYLVDDLSDVARIMLPYSKSWPDFTPYPIYPVRVRYVAGYNDDNPIPPGIKSAMLLLIGHYYEHREAVNIGAINMSQKLKEGIDALLTPKKAGWF